ncbi:MAG: helix-turn-helix domain-containing protein [Pirellula sp.]|jgi:excisionase family DNA binding protein|nr:helix-turn-helix domain-containing protein [Pirellula sp.]
MSNYVSLDEAAKILGITTDELIDMRSRGEIFGYRDGTSWKFKKEEIDRVQDELGGDALDEEAGGSSVLVSERQVGPAGSKSGNTIGKGAGSDVSLDSDLRLTGDEGSAGSDVALVPDPASDSGVKLVQRNKPTGSEGSGIRLDAETREGGSDEVDLGSDLKLMDESPDASGIDLLKGSPDSNVLDSQLTGKGGSSKSGPKSGTGSGSLDLGGDLELAKDDEDDLVLGSDSGVGLGSESGINLMSPSDSGLSLEDEPLDLAGTGISGLDLGGEVGSGTGSGAGKSAVGSGVGSALGSGALVDFQQGEEFQLTPSGSIETDDDSSSQVIELEDSSSFGDVGMPDSDFGAVQEAGMGEGGFDDMALDGAAGAVALRGSPEVPYTGLQVGMLVVILLLMGLGGILTTDILRNLWAWDGETDYSTGLTSMLVKAIGGS